MSLRTNADMLLGLDVGTTAVKAAVFSDDGRLCGYGFREYAVSFPEPARAEQDAVNSAIAEQARQAAAAAQAAADAAARQAAQNAAASGSGGGGGGGDGQLSPGEAQSVAYGMIQSYGWGDGQFSCLVKLWTQESSWRWWAENPDSGAYGIPQSLPASKMASAGADYRTNAITQMRWGLSYISGRYGTPCAAWDHETSYWWY